MTDFLESVRPAGPMSSTETIPSIVPGEPTVRQLLTELAHLEDVVRGAGSLDDPEALAALAREQAIIDELHRRNP